MRRIPGICSGAIRTCTPSCRWTHIYGNTHLGPDAAYRFAKGERVDLPGGGEAVLKRPLDFLVVADHAEYLGVQAGLNDGNPDLLETETGRQDGLPPDLPRTIQERAYTSPIWIRPVGH